MNISSGSKSVTPAKWIVVGAVIVVLLLGAAAIILFTNMPDANAFNARVERIFVENDDLTGAAEIRLLEVLAQSGTAFSETLNSYRFVIFVLFVFAAALLIAVMIAAVFLWMFTKRLAEVERAGIEVQSLIINRGEKSVRLNDMEFGLTDSVLETLSVLAEARMDHEVLSGAEIESVISGKNVIDCEESAGATRIKRLRDHLGNQMMSELLIRNISKKGYILSIDPQNISVR